jgi:hypothetical protein
MMGTSGSYGGAGNRSPLIPRFLDDPASGFTSVIPAPAPPVAPPASNPAVVPAGPAAPTAPNPATIPPGAVVPPQPRPAPPQGPPPNRFTAPRTNFSRFASSGGSDRRAMGRAVSGYVSSGAGGARQAARRMGSSRQAGARLYSFLADAQARGPVEALRSLNLAALAGRPIEEVFIGVAEYVCPVGGTVDEGIARDAFVEMVAELADQGVTDFDTLTPEQMQTVFEMFVSNAVEARIYNDVGKNGITLPDDVNAVEEVQAQLHDFVARAVSDALATNPGQAGTLTPQQALQHVDAIYETAFEMLRSMGDEEAER